MMLSHRRCTNCSPKTMWKTTMPCLDLTTRFLSSDGRLCHLITSLNGWFAYVVERRKRCMDALRVFQWTWWSTETKSKWRRLISSVSTRVSEQNAWHLFWSKKSQDESMSAISGKLFTQLVSQFLHHSQELPIGTEVSTQRNSLTWDSPAYPVALQWRNISKFTNCQLK